MSAAQPREGIPACGRPGDLLAKIIILAPPSDEEEIFEERATVVHYARDLAERHELYRMLGLDEPPAEHPEPGANAFPMLRFTPAKSTKGRRSRR